MKKIVYLPLDERPCNYAFAQALSKDNPDYRLVAPSKDVLGEKKKAADFEKLAAFLEKECADAHGLVLSVDMLLYGGIVPSRLHTLSAEELETRLRLIKRLKSQNGALKIYAFALIMRCPSYSSNDEEPEYYERCGREIFLRGQAVHKLAENVITEREYVTTVTELDAKIGDDLVDYLTRREVNLSALCKTLAMVGKEIEKFVIPQDDSSPYGYTALDQQKVKRYIGEHGVPEIDIYPGADEVGMTLLSAMVNDMHGYAPKICPVYPQEACKKVVPLYEDRAVEQSIASQIRNAGCVLTDDRSAADILLFCNLPVGKMTHIGEDGGTDYEKRDLAAFTAQMKAAAESGKRVAAADIAYCNGGDKDWVQLLEKEIGLFRLSGYAGWNTSSNTLGTVICQSVLHYYYGDTETHRAFTAERIYEDVGYCGYVRKYLCNEVLPKMNGVDYFHADGKRGEVAACVRETLEGYIQAQCPSVHQEYAIADCEMPWSRMFEVGLTVRKR